MNPSNNKPPRIRSLPAALEELKRNDPYTAVTIWLLRGLVNRGEIPHHRVGRKAMIDMSKLEEFLSNPHAEKEEKCCAGIRRIKL